MGNAALASDARFQTNTLRVANRPALEALVQAVFATLAPTEAVGRLEQAQTAYGAINSVDELIAHPQLRTKPMRVRGQVALLPAPPYRTEWEDVEFPPAPELPRA
jgi:crotonobetainyl-CoA:carnitine CoA-transferase CaiB-like acyl-CoA transferase